MGFTRNEVMPSKWLKSEDFEDGEIKTLTIKDVTQEEFKDKAGKPEQKFILHFRDDKPMVLNKTNAKLLFDILGEDTDEWFGKRIDLYTMEVESFGEMTNAIRIRKQLPGKGTTTRAVELGTEASATPFPDPMQQSTRAQIIAHAELVWGKENAPDRLKEFINKETGRKFSGLSEFEAQQALEKLQGLPSVANDGDEENDPFSDD